MTVPGALLDPWIVRRGKSLDERLRSLQDLRSLTSRNQIRAIPFLPVGFSESDFADSPKTIPGIIRAVLTALERRSPPKGVLATIKDEPSPADLGDNWLMVLGDCIHVQPDSPRWRDPMILTSKSRSTVWPRSTEIRVGVEAQTVSRVLACVEDMYRNVLARRDIDPWCLDPVGDAPVEHQLPRPPQFRDAPITQWRDVANSIADWTCGIGTHRFFVPLFDVPPHAIDKETWRAGRCFARAHKRTVSGLRGAGQYVDRWGNVWGWDIGHKGAHWDVRVRDDAKQYHRVLVDGLFAGTKPITNP